MALDSKKLWITLGLGSLIKCLESAETYCLSWCTADTRGDWEGHGADYRSPSPEHPWHPLLPSAAQQLHDMLLAWKGSWPGELGKLVSIYMYRYPYIYTSAYTHKHTCSSGKRKGQGDSMAYGEHFHVPALQCSEGSVTFSCPMGRELIALDSPSLPS